MTNRPVRVLLADDHALVRDGLKRLIDEQPDMTVVAEAADGREALRLAQSHAPDVALVDISMPGGNGAELAQELARTCPATRVIAVTRHDDLLFVRKMRAAGALGYVLKQSAGTELVKAVRDVVEGRPYLDPSLEAPMSDRQSYPPPPVSAAPSEPLTTREEDVLCLIAASWTHQRIADHLAIDVSDVLVLRMSAMRKAALQTRMQIIQYARARGWRDASTTLPPDPGRSIQ